MSQSVDEMKPNVTLARELDILATDSLHASLLSVMDDSGPLVVAAESVERLATPCVEVLLAASKSAEAYGRSFHIVNPSAKMAEVFEMLGLEGVLNSWRVIQ